MAQLPADFPAMPAEDASFAVVITWLIELIRWWFARDSSREEGAEDGEEASEGPGKAWGAGGSRAGGSASGAAMEAGRAGGAGEPGRPEPAPASPAEGPDGAEAAGPGAEWTPCPAERHHPQPSGKAPPEETPTEWLRPPAPPRTMFQPRRRSAPDRSKAWAPRRRPGRSDGGRRACPSWPTGDPSHFSTTSVISLAHAHFVTISKHKSDGAVAPTGAAP